MHQQHDVVDANIIKFGFDDCTYVRLAAS